MPNLKADIDWAIEGPKLQQRIIDALDQSMLPGLKDHIEAEFYMTPENFRDDYLSTGRVGIFDRADLSSVGLVPFSQPG